MTYLLFWPAKNVLICVKIADKGKILGMTSILGLLRVKQWTKNSLVFLAPFSAGVFGINASTAEAIQAFACFCLASSTGYIINDWKDRTKDALHPKKKTRPIAAGEVSGKKCVSIILTLLVIQILIETQLNIKFAICLNLYLLNSVVYTIFLKNIAVVEMIAVSMGFILRPIGGAIATRLTVSSWFLLVIGFASLFLVASKRLAEYKTSNAAQKRSVVLSYTSTFLESVSTLSLGMTIVTYSLWAFEFPNNRFLLELSIIPVILALLRYLWHRDKGDAETPEEMLFSDQALPICGFVTLVILILAFYK